jgi:undecaprenyl-phosphate 4-deoxy-4-formamido-L-arabinose transferase
MKISIVIPVFNESKNTIEELCKRIDSVCKKENYSYEVLFIDDGSTNDILDFLKSLHQKDKRLKVISLDNNCGQMTAFLAGLYSAKGDVLILMDADLQYIPEEIPLFIEKINEGYEAVGGRRPKESRGFLSQLLTFYFNLKLKTKLDDHGCSYAALRRELVAKILKFNYPLCIKPLAVMLAKKGIEIDITHSRRKYGKSSYSFFKYLWHGIRYIHSFSVKDKKPSKSLFKIKLNLLD